MRHRSVGSSGPNWELGPGGQALARSVWIFAALIFLVLAPLTYADITYVHDADGRLVAVIDGSGDAVTYTYDSDGNVTATQTSNSSSGEAIYALSPDNGSVGSQVTIYGNDFSASPAVTFNGKPATVSSSTSTTIFATVPSGATSGTVAVDSVQGPTFTVN